MVINPETVERSIGAMNGNDAAALVVEGTRPRKLSAPEVRLVVNPSVSVAPLWSQAMVYVYPPPDVVGALFAVNRI